MKINCINIVLLLTLLIIILLVILQGCSGGYKQPVNYKEKIEKIDSAFLLKGYQVKVNESTRKILFGQLSKLKAHLFFRVNNNDCKMCIDPALKVFFKLDSNVLKEQCHLLYDRQEKMSFMSWRYYNKEQTEDIGISNNELPFKLSKTPYSYFFILDTNGVANNFFLPKYDQMNEIKNYFIDISSRYFR